MTAPVLPGASIVGASIGRSNTAPRLPTALRWQFALQLATVFAAYFAAGKVGLAVPFTSGNVSPIWPPAGIALAAVLLFGARVWPAIAAGALLVNLFSPIPPAAAAALAVGNTGGAVAGGWLLRRLPGFQPSLCSLRDVLGLLLLAAPASAAISATVGVCVLFLTGVDPWARFWAAWPVWWLGDVMGVLLMTPFVLTVFQRRQIPGLHRLLELVVLLSAVVGTCLVILHKAPNLGEKDVLVVAVLPFVLWAATRFEILGAAGLALLVACIAVWETASGRGPFVRNGTLENATMLQAFLAVISVSGLTLAAVIVERAKLTRWQAQREGREETERQYREIVETANDGIWTLDGDLRTVFVNPRMAALLGYTVEEMSGRPLSDFLSETAWAAKRAALQLVGTSERDLAEGEYRKKDGSPLWALVSRTRAFGEDGTLTGVLKMVTDLSDQKRAEAERQQAVNSNLLLSSAVEQTADTVLISDSTGHIEYVNPAFEQTTGYTRDEAIGNTPRLLKSGRHGESVYREMWAQLLRGEPYHGTLVNRKKTGELYWTDQTITPIKDAAGNVEHFVAVLKDVTAIRKFHEQEVKLGLARAVQQRFFPLPPDLPGLDIGAASCPADQTGGDYFDFIEAPNGIWYLAVGDVSGHGFDAALIMALARAYTRSFATLDMEVGEVLGRVNKVILGDLEANRYVTMLLVRLDTRAWRLTYASAGHIDGVLMEDGGKADWIMHSTGVPLGLFPDSAFATRQFELRRGQILVLGTDGATETCDAEGREFGGGGVMQYVRTHADNPAGDIAAGVCGAARAFAASPDQQDDVTSLIVKVAGAVEAWPRAFKGSSGTPNPAGRLTLCGRSPQSPPSE